MGNPTRAPMLRISSSEILLSKLHSFAISSIKKRVVTRGSRLVCWPVKKSNPNTRGKKRYSHGKNNKLSSEPKLHFAFSTKASGLNL